MLRGWFAFWTAAFNAWSAYLAAASYATQAWMKAFELGWVWPADGIVHSRHD